MDNRLAGGILTIELDAIVQNFETLRRAIGPATCAAVVKADAYGLGVAQIAPRLFQAGCREFFVATVNEGLALRSMLQGPARLYVLCCPAAESLPVLAPAGIIPVLNSVDDVEAAYAYARRSREAVAVAIQFDTGLSRLGLSGGEWARFQKQTAPADVPIPRQTAPATESADSHLRLRAGLHRHAEIQHGGVPPAQDQ